jgi:hypothetical protein
MTFLFIGLTLLAGLGMAWLEFNRLPFREALLRTCLCCIALACMCLLVFRPTYQVSRPAGTALLITEPGKNIPDSLDSFVLGDLYLDRKLHRVHDVAQFHRQFPQYGQVLVLGYGLSPEKAGDNLTYLDSLSPEGFQALDYKSIIREGDSLIVFAQYQHRQPDTLYIRLITEGRPSDSVALTQGTHAIWLKGLPRTTGRFIASLEMRYQEKLRTEPLPYQVHKREPLRITLLLSYPDPEINSLKEWLSRQGHAISFRSQLSRDRFALQQINRKGQSPVLLSAKDLSQTDLLLADNQSLSSLNPSLLNQAIREGMGLLLLADDKWTKRPVLTGRSIPLSTSNKKRFQIQGDTQGESIEKQPATLLPTDEMLPLVYSQEGELVAAAWLMGRGKIGVSLASTTFAWRLEGEDEKYSRFWTKLVEGLSRKPQTEVYGQPFFWKEQVAELFTFPTKEAIHLQYAAGETEQVKPQTAWPDWTRLSYVFYPGQSGWMQGMQANGHLQWEYVLEKGEWQDLLHYRWWLDRKKGQALLKPGLASVSIPVSAVWFFIPLILTLGGIWWREKAY